MNIDLNFEKDEVMMVINKTEKEIPKPDPSKPDKPLPIPQFPHDPLPQLPIPLPGPNPKEPIPDKPKSEDPPIYFPPILPNPIPEPKLPNKPKYPGPNRPSVPRKRKRPNYEVIYNPEDWIFDHKKHRGLENQPEFPVPDTEMDTMEDEEEELVIKKDYKRDLEIMIYKSVGDVKMRMFIMKLDCNEIKKVNLNGGIGNLKLVFKDINNLYESDICFKVVAESKRVFSFDSKWVNVDFNISWLINKKVCIENVDGYWKIDGYFYCEVLYVEYFKSMYFFRFNLFGKDDRNWNVSDNDYKKDYTKGLPGNIGLVNYNLDLWRYKVLDDIAAKVKIQYKKLYNL